MAAVICPSAVICSRNPCLELEAVFGTHACKVASARVSAIARVRDRFSVLPEPNSYSMTDPDMAEHMQ